MKQDRYDEALMWLALGEAHAAARRGEVPVGAVISIGPQVVATAGNARESDRDPTAHAEIRAIQAASQALGRWRLSDATLYVTLEPCPMCAGAIWAARIGRVVYGADDARAGAVRSLFAISEDPRLNHRSEVRRGVEATSARDLLQLFFSERRGMSKRRERDSNPR